MWDLDDFLDTQRENECLNLFFMVCPASLSTKGVQYKARCAPLNCGSGC